MATLAQLEQEVNRIISSPYSVSLKKLDDILSLTDGDAVCEWAYTHPCQAQRLASAVTEGLKLWPYTIRIVKELSQSEALRDAILRQEPALLDTLLGKAITSSRDDNEYSNICVALLSEPLPSDLPLPASAQVFFLRIFESAVRSPSNENIGRVYALLDGACGELLGLLPQGTLNRFEEHLERVMRDLKGFEEGSPFVLCLWIMKALAGPFNWSTPNTLLPPSGSVSSSSPRPETPNWRSDAARSFFTGSKAAKTMPLLTLRVIFACKEGIDMSLHQVIEDVKAANEAVQAVDTAVRHEWSRANNLHIRKLVEKAMRPDIHPDLQLQALTFIGLITSIDHISAQLTTAYEKLLVAYERLSARPRHLTKTFRTSLQIFSSRISETFCKDVLHKILLAIVRPASSNLHDARTLHMLVVELTEVAQEMPALRNGFLLALSANELQEAINQFLELCPSGTRGSSYHEAGCNDAIDDAKRRLGVVICSLLLKAALSSQADEIGIVTPLAMALFDKQQALAARLSPCKHSLAKVKRSLAVPMFQEECTPGGRLLSHGWRDRLATGLETEGKLKHEFIVRTVGEVCRDLEERCAKAEEPLHREQARYKDLEARFNELSAHASDLEAQAVDRNLVMDAMEVEKTQIETHLRAAELENDELSERVEELQHLLKEANEDAERSLNAVRLDFDRNLIELQAARAFKDEALQTERGGREALERELHELQSELQSAKQDAAQLQSDYATLHDQLGTLQHKLDSESTCRAQRESEISILTAKETSLSKELEALQVEIELAKSHNEAIEVEGAKRTRASREELESLRKQHEMELEKAAAQMTEIKISLTTQLQHNDEELVQARKSHEITLVKLHEKQLSLSNMQKKIEQLQRVCMEKDLEIAQLAKMRQMMTTALGLTDNTLGFAMRLDMSRDASNVHPKTPGRSRKNRRSSEVQMNIPVEDQGEAEDAELNADRSFGSSTSSKNGPTPKRTRPRKSFKIPTIHQPRLNTGATTSRCPQKGGSALRRPPLTDVSLGRGNASPTRRNHGITGEADKQSLTQKGLDDLVLKPPEEAEDLSFDASGILTSTPATPRAVGARNSQKIFDETTADF